MLANPYFLALLPFLLLASLITFACLLSLGLINLIGNSFPIDKLISKITQVMLILSIFPIKSYLKLNWSDLGLANRQVFFKQLGQGLLLSLITLLPVLLTLFVLDVHVWDESRNWTLSTLISKLGLGLLLALLIAISEEILFRGLLLTTLRKYLPLIWAIIISSFYYASLHFLKSKTSVAFDDLSITNVFKLVPEAFGNWFNPAIASAWLALFVVGLFLALIRSQIPNSLGLCIGCHCGWVWQIKASKDLCNVNEQSDYLFLVSHYDGVVGPLVSFWLALAILTWYLFQNGHTNRPDWLTRGSK